MIVDVLGVTDILRVIFCGRIVDSETPFDWILSSTSTVVCLTIIYISSMLIAVNKLLYQLHRHVEILLSWDKSVLFWLYSAIKGKV